jgi:O-antigen/teichoic acid export membrane protein
MTERSATQTFPRRDADGRVISLKELLVAVIVGTLLGLVALALIDGVFSLIGLGDFGHASGWLTAVLPIFLFVDDFRGWKRAGGARRWIVAAVGLGVALAAGLIAASLVSGLPAILSGFVGALVLGLFYMIIWYVWIRQLTGQTTTGDAA